jgi:NAD-dependent dihydropyrimidine dehydrogenase PreA subunit
MITLDKDACTGCRMCVKVCPHGVLAIADKKAVIAFEDRCVECAACQLNCHYDAMKVTKGVGCLTVIIRQDILRMNPKNCACCVEN